MNPNDPTLPNISLNRFERQRMIVVGIIVAIALARVVPDFVRVVYPRHVFAYTTNADGVVVKVPPRALATTAPTPAPKHTAAPQKAKPRGRLVSGLQFLQNALRGRPRAQPAGDAIEIGDRVRIDRIRPFDRKPGLAGFGYTYDNPVRYLPIERAGSERVLHLVSTDEQFAVRFLDMLHIGLYMLALGLGAILFLVKPGIATAAFFGFCLAGVDAPSTYLAAVIPNPWRPLPGIVGDLLHGAALPSLLLFAFCLIDGDEDAPRERLFAWIAAVTAVGLGALAATIGWREHYAGLPAEHFAVLLRDSGTALDVLIAIALAVAFVRGSLNDRHRIGWIIASFAFAVGCAWLSNTLFPAGRIPAWFNSILVSASIVPIVTVWIAVVRHQFFNVDFVVSRAVVYAALTAGVIGTISVTEEIGTYLFYQNTDLAYGILIAISIGIGAMTGKLKELLDHIVDRFIFRDRRAQREALEFIAGYILDAESVDDVYRALLEDAPHALKLAFGGLLARQRDGSYRLAASSGWPEGLTLSLGPSDELTLAIVRTRGALSFTGRDTRLIQESFPNERLAFVAPIFYDREVSGIIVYGHNVSGLDLDPEEREQLIRVVAHASIALNAIELAKYRAESVGVDVSSVAAETLPAPTMPLPGTG
ncbi:hypothetical protein WPS_07200 [Vulcanimicrobium alpinum]|uniref:GAF domain-containing protein n=1 Tax=Vulcanimicrobium alpinum TaxID=3016050 RepID=A0AAN2C8N2_UNVUL|nr:GAF domain-containing protein [Vulcanimicrobium alpinum]BDE05444.1 hypothetical protein WPS_07200 [Vulcanimicrobium alpinum]